MRALLDIIPSSVSWASTVGVQWKAAYQENRVKQIGSSSILASYRASTLSGLCLRHHLACQLVYGQSSKNTGFPSYNRRSKVISSRKGLVSKTASYLICGTICTIISDTLSTRL